MALVDCAVVVLVVVKAQVVLLILVSVYVRAEVARGARYSRNARVCACARDTAVSCRSERMVSSNDGLRKPSTS